MSKWHQILRGFRKSKNKQILKVTALYVIWNPKRRQSYPTWPHYDQALLTFLPGSGSIKFNNSNRGQEFQKIRGSNPPSGRSKKLSFFLFIFKFSIQNWVSLILTIFWYLILLFWNQIKLLKTFVFIHTRFVKQDINRWFIQFCMEDLKMKRKRVKKIDLQVRGFLNNFPGLDFNFQGRWGWRDQIQATF